MDRAWQLAHQTQSPLTLILLDIDYFKRYNDCYGHQAGDDCLRLVAQSIKSAVPSDAGVVARYGGEEFAILLNSDRSHKGQEIACAIQQAIAQANIQHNTSPVSSLLTVSQGIGSVVPNNENTPSTLIEMADRALYRAKAEGRNQIVSADNVVWSNPC